MTGFELSLEDFTYLIDAASRHHVAQVAGWVSLTAHRREAATVFLRNGVCEITLAEVHRLCEADPTVKRLLYNLFMYYAH